MPGPFFLPCLAPWPHPAMMPPVVSKKSSTQQLMSPENEDMVKLLSNSEAQEFTFRPAPEHMGSSHIYGVLLRKTFNHCLDDNEEEAIMTDFSNRIAPTYRPLNQMSW